MRHRINLYVILFFYFQYRLEKLRGYTGKDVLLRLPGDLTVFDIDWMGLYCIQFEQNFGHVMIPERPNVPPNLEDLMSASKYFFLIWSVAKIISFLIECKLKNHFRIFKMVLSLVVLSSSRKVSNAVNVFWPFCNHL